MTRKRQFCMWHIINILPWLRHDILDLCGADLTSGQPWYRSWPSPSYCSHCPCSHIQILNIKINYLLWTKFRAEMWSNSLMITTYTSEVKYARAAKKWVDIKSIICKVGLTFDSVKHIETESYSRSTCKHYNSFRKILDYIRTNNGHWSSPAYQRK